MKENTSEEKLENKVENSEVNDVLKEKSPDAKEQKKKEKPKKEKTMKIKESEYQKLVSDAAEFKDKHLRLYAEFDNARKRMEREKMEFAKYANIELIAEFLEILDNLERTIESATAKHEDYAAFVKGIEMVMNQTHEMLKKNGVKPIEATGKVFDPHCHEALMQVESDDVDEGVVLEEFQKGYSINDRVIRTTKVKLAKKCEVKKETEIKQETIDVESSSDGNSENG